MVCKERTPRRPEEKFKRSERLSCVRAPLASLENCCVRMGGVGVEP